ncbi:MAG: Gfo/Idh/MocA family oxidoreductase [Ruminococcaceae bacterium]|nr:Gfo/Idh/MocA family oxidoreductase [Oscillospiraceae bacterium]
MLKSVIIGCGAISHTHINSINGNNLGKIIAVCDIVEERAKAVSAEAGCDKYYTDYKTMLTECSEADVVHICTPHYLHAEMAIFALEHGFDVYLEKPCAMTPTEAKTIVEASERTGKKVCVSFQNRLVKTTAAAKRIISEGRLGKLLGMKGIVTWERSGKYYTESGWRGTWATEGGGVLMNQSIHTLDLLYCFGGKVKSVEGSVALRKNKGTIEVEDTAEATILFENGISAIFYATNCNVVTTPAELELILEKGRLLISNDILYEITDGHLREAAENTGAAVGKSVWGSGHTLMIGNFYKVLRGEQAEYCDITDAYQVLEIIEKIYETSPLKLR